MFDKDSVESFNSYFPYLFLFACLPTVFRYVSPTQVHRASKDVTMQIQAGMNSSAQLESVT